MKNQNDMRRLSLIIPSIASAVGFFCFSVLAFSFSELGVLPAWFRTSLVVVGSLSLAFGGEVGTLTSVVEIYRKPEIGFWDGAGLVISVISTVSSFVLAFAALLGASASWGPVVKVWGPIWLGIVSALDSYVNFLELGLYMSRGDSAEEAATQKEERRKERLANAELSAEIARLRADVARHDATNDANDVHDNSIGHHNDQVVARKITKGQFMSAISGLNGDTPRDADAISAWCGANGYADPPLRTRQRWAAELARDKE